MALLDKLQSADDLGEEIDADPEPDEKPRRRRSTKARTPAPKVTRPATKSINVMAREVGNDLATMLEMTAVVWGVRDHCCAPVLAEQSKPIGQALAAILARNPELLRKFANAETGVFVMQMLTLGRALLPVGQAIFRNHVAKTGDDDEFQSADLSAFPAFSGANGAGRHPA